MSTYARPQSLLLLLAGLCLLPPTARGEDGACARNLDEHLLPFWTSDTLRPAAANGFLPVMLRDGQVTDETVRLAIVYLRQLYVDAVALRRSTDPAARARLSARLRERLQRLEADYWDPDDGGFHWELNRAAIPPTPRKGSLVQAYATYTLAEVARFTADARARKLAEQAFAHLDSTAHDAAHGGYVEDADHPLDAQVNAMKSLSLQIHALLALAALHDVSPRRAPPARARELLDRLWTHLPLSGPTPNVRNAVARDWSPLPDGPELERRTCYGHTAELYWYSERAIAAFGFDAAPWEPAMRRVVEGLLAHGITPDGACLFAGPLVGPADQRTVYWWAQGEALVASLYAWRRWARPEHAKAHRRLHAWTFRHLVRPGSAWEAVTDERGVVQSDFLTGGNWKAGLHEVRAMLACEELGSALPP